MDIPVPSGWTTNKEIQIGDKLFDDNGQICNVVSKINKRQICYRIIFSDESEVICGKDQLWKAESSKDRTRRHKLTDSFRTKRKEKRVTKTNIKHSWGPECIEYSGPSLYTAEHISKTVIGRVEKSGQMHSNYSIENAKPLELPAKDFPIDPLILGLWLGDGTKDGFSYVVDDKDAGELIDIWLAAGFKMTKHKADFMWGISCFVKTLKSLDLINNKHVPKIYLRGSKEQRLNLLKGLMATDGTCSKIGTPSFTNTNKRIIDGTLELILSLGIRARAVEGIAKLNGKDCGPVWDIIFNTELPVFCLGRKQILQKTNNFRGVHNRRYIVSVEEQKCQLVSYLEVNSKNHMYLCGKQFIPTHDSFKG